MDVEHDLDKSELLIFRSELVQSNRTVKVPLDMLFYTQHVGDPNMLFYWAVRDLTSAKKYLLTIETRFFPSDVDDGKIKITLYRHVTSQQSRANEYYTAAYVAWVPFALLMQADERGDKTYDVKVKYDDVFRRNTNTQLQKAEKFLDRKTERRLKHQTDSPIYQDGFHLLHSHRIDQIW